MTKRNSIYRRRGKRAFDFVLASLGLLILSPLLVLCAIAVRLTSRGPIFFCQVRPGLQGRPFKLFKFRTMRQGAEKSGAAVVVPKDSRLTPIGALLRRTKLDEIPQLINVLLGDISLVGPRPRPQENIDLRRPEERALLGVRPGITSYATVYHHSEEEYCNQQKDPHVAYQEIQSHKCHLDAAYLEDMSFWVDIKLLLLTLVLVMPGKGKPERTKFGTLKVGPYSRATKMLLEGLFCALAVWLAYWLRFDEHMPQARHIQRDLFIVFLPLTRLTVNRILGAYNMFWRYVNRVDAMVLAMDNAVVSAALLLLRLMLPEVAAGPSLFSVPLGVIIPEYLLVVFGTAGMRLLRRNLYVASHRYQPSPPSERRRILILGAGLTGLEMALAMARRPHLEVIGFLDDDPSKRGCVIGGFRVLGDSGRLSDILSVRQITDLIICAQSVSPAHLRRIREACRPLGVLNHLIPTLDQALGLGQIHEEMVVAPLEMIGKASRTAKGSA
jgi:lipopolysaccharide/colanic/teichoic acid biosynthesis glycosyltransferase